MKRRIIIFLGLVTIAIIIISFNKKNLRLKTDKIVEITIQHKTDIISIEDPYKLMEFLNNFSELDFELYGSAMGRKGWMYWIKCYSTDSLVYDFTIQDNETIKFNNFFYKTKNDYIDVSYLEHLFINK